MSDSVFNEKEGYLISALEEVTKRDDMATEIEKLQSQSKKIGRNISAEERSISEEIQTTVRKRKQEISATYDNRLDDNRARKKRVLNKREKKKTQKVNERIADETKDIRDDTKALEDEMKTLLKKNGVPRFCSTKVFYHMYMPKGIGEIGAMLLSFAIFFLGIPALLAFILRMTMFEGAKHLDFITMVVLFMFIILNIIIYFLVYTKTKAEHQDVLRQSRSIMDKIKANKKQADAIENQITKDKDESSYNLGAYDEQLEDLEAEAEAITTEKKDALKTFEEETQNVIKDEINSRRLDGLNAMKKEKKEIDSRIEELEKLYSEKVRQITNDFVPYLGEEICNKDKLHDLITLMEDGQAETVSEALSLYKGQKSSK